MRVREKCVSLRPVQLLMMLGGAVTAEIIPFKPDSVSTDVGKACLSHFQLKFTPSCYKTVFMKKILFFCGIIMLPFSGKAQTPENHLVKQERLDSIVVSSARAGKNTPVAYTQLTKKALQRQASSHSLPMLLDLEPSVVTTTEGGLGLGYSRISVRGSDASRINITLNGIPVNDAESQEVFWVNLPSIQQFLQSVQIQRGVGTSVNGPGAFGATINMQTLLPEASPYGTAEFSLGSYQTYMTTVGAGTGVTRSGFSLDVRYSHSNTKGYIRNAKADLNSLFASLGWRNKNNSLKLNYIYGDQSTGITWEGLDPALYDTDRRYNIAGQYFDDAGNEHFYDNETDNYKQHFVQLFYTRQFGEYFTWNTALGFTKGDGYYENYKYDEKFSKYGLEPQNIEDVTYSRSDFIIQQAMDNAFYSASSNLSYNRKNIRAVAGAAYSFYDGDHFGDLLWSKYNRNIPSNYRWYLNNGKKNEAAVFVRGEWDICKAVTAFADLQYRHAGFKLSGEDKDFVSLENNLNYNFFNPKAGVTVNVSPKSKLYASLSVGHREPSRSDVKESIKSGREDEIKPERMLDYELGYKYMSEKLSLSANLYFMEYKDQLVATGKLSETGYVIKENIPDSYRRGVELAAAWQIARYMRFDANLTLSKNKVKNYTAWMNTYDNDQDWNEVPQTPVYYKNTNLTLSPEIVGMAMITVNPIPSMILSLNGKYVGKQYMDNSSDAIARTPGYFVAGFNASQNFTLKNASRITVSFAVDNLFDNKYYSYGWISREMFSDGSPTAIYKGIFPQAEINFIARVAYEF